MADGYPAAPRAPLGPVGGEVGVAVVGAGYWGPNLIRNFLGCEETWLWSVCDRDLDRARQVVGRYSSLDVTDRLENVLDDPRIEAVAIATPVASHHAIAMACIAAGKHVLVEKPLATTALEASNGEVKTAIVASLLAIEPYAARERLTATNGVVRTAIEGAGS